MRRLAVALALIAVAVGLYLGAKPRRASPAAEAAPALTLTDLDGNPVRTRAYTGKVVLVNFWAAWCVPCRDEIPQFVALQEKYRPRGFQAIGISMEDPEGPLREFYREYKMNYPVIMGNQKIAEDYGGVMGLPTTLLIGRDGLVHARHAGATDFPKLEQEVVSLLNARQ